MLCRSLVAAIATFIVGGISSPLLSADYVKIGAWNIENLGNRTPGQRPIAIAEHIELSGVEVLCLEEIHVTSMDGGNRKNDVLDSAFGLLNSAGSDWTYELLPNRNSTDTSQLCGVAWNKNAVSRVGTAFPISISDNSLWDRRPHAVKFSMGAGKTDFVLIPVHMKANSDGAQLGRSQRKKEAAALINGMNAVRANFTAPSEATESDIIILGDTNILAFDEQSNEVITEAGFRDLNSADGQTYVRGTAPFDRIYVALGQPETKFARQYVMRATEPEEHEEFLSDHFLILTAIKVENDDDQ